MDVNNSMNKSTEILLGRKPMRDDLMHVYTNFEADQPTQLTQEAIRCC